MRDFSECEQVWDGLSTEYSPPFDIVYFDVLGVQKVYFCHRPNPHPPPWRLCHDAALKTPPMRRAPAHPVDLALARRACKAGDSGLDMFRSSWIVLGCKVQSSVYQCLPYNQRPLLLSTKIRLCLAWCALKARAVRFLGRSGFWLVLQSSLDSACSKCAK